MNPDACVWTAAAPRLGYRIRPGRCPVVLREPCYGLPGALPLWLAHVLSERNIFPTSFSKFGTAHIRRKETMMYRQKCYKLASGF